MKTRLTFLAASVALLVATTPAQTQRWAEIMAYAFSLQVRINEPNGVDQYTLYEGSGIGGPVRTPATPANCSSYVYFELGHLAQHGHPHTIVWDDCLGTQHRWVLPTPVSCQLLVGTPLAVATPLGFGCGASAPLGLDLDGPPALGTNRNFLLTDIPAGTLFAAVYFSDSLAPTAAPLAWYGLPAWQCYVFIDINGGLLAGAGAGPGTAASYPIAIPSAPGLSGALGYAQAIALSPGQNPAGVITSNGLGMAFAH